MSDIFTFIILCTRVVFVKGVNFQSMARGYYKHEALSCIFSHESDFLVLDIQYSSLYNV